jgi:hypothetical protein
MLDDDAAPPPPPPPAALPGRGAGARACGGGTDGPDIPLASPPKMTTQPPNRPTRPMMTATLLLFEAKMLGGCGGRGGAGGMNRTRGLGLEKA